jgi:hypothetical protein
MVSSSALIRSVPCVKMTLPEYTLVFFESSDVIVSDSSSIGLSRSAFSAKTKDELMLMMHKLAKIIFSDDTLKKEKRIIFLDSYFE